MSNTAENSTQRVLVIGDGTDWGACTDCLQQAGLDVVEARDGEAGFALARRAKPDLILLAQILPGIDGVTICRRFRADDATAEIPVIIASSVADVSAKIEAFAAGAVDYVTTPFLVEEVLARVRSHLELVRLRRQNAKDEAAQEELKAWIERYELTVAASGQVAYEYFLSTGHITWGTSIEAVLGYSGDEMGGGFAQWESLLHPNDRAEAMAALDAALQACKYWDAQYRLRHKGGHYVWIRDRGFFLPDETGQASRQLGLLEDITEKMRTLEELRYRNTLLATQQETSPDGILVVDAGGRILSWNRRFTELWGIPNEIMKLQRDEGALRSVANMVSDPESFRQRIAYLYAHPDCTGRDEINLVDGRVFDRYSATVREADGTDYGRIWYFSDITDRKRVEETLRKSNRRFATIFRANPVAISIVRARDRRFIDVNDAHARLFGWSRESQIGRTATELDLWADPQERDRLLESLRSEGSIRGAEARFRAANGRILTALFTMESVEIDEERCWLCLFSDITQRKLHEQERARLEAQLNQAQRLESVGRLAGGVAHDFNNLLSVIIGYSELLLPEMSPEDHKHPWVEQILHAGEKAAALTRQLLAFSRRQMIQPRPLNINEVITSTEKMLRRLIGEDVELRIVLSPAIGAVVADPGQIDQILLNLAVNARDAMPSGGQLTIETAVANVDSLYQAGHAEASPGRFVLLTVSDTGVGMDVETQQHIFEPFFTTKDQGHGTGLGLATIYGIVKQSGGWLSVYSEPGKGSVFRLYFPMTREPCQALEPRETVTTNLHGTETILLVEDQEEVRNLAVTALQEHGYRVLPTANSDEALALLNCADNPIAVLVTDIVLPGMSGLELGRRVIALRPQIKVIYTSGYTEDMILNRGVPAFGIEFLPKPYTATTLTAHIRKVLD
jgi:PAS domain S-box-containing protein